jgi:hypothetical protein
MPRPRHFLLIMPHEGYFVFFASAVKELLRRGHLIRVLFDGTEKLAWPPGAPTNEPRLKFGLMHTLRDPLWSTLSMTVRLCMDYLRFFRPEYREFPKFLGSMKFRLPMYFVNAMNNLYFRWRLNENILLKWLNQIEHLLPTDHSVVQTLRDEPLDALVVAPMVEPGSFQADYVRSARRRGIPTGICFAGWDDITNKGFVRGAPSRTFVWTRTHAVQAIASQGLPKESIRVVGLPHVDSQSLIPSLGADEFMSKIGMNKASAFLFYYAPSGLYYGIHEPRFGVKWLESIRSSENEELRKIPVLIWTDDRSLWDSVDLFAYNAFLISADVLLFNDAIYYCTAFVMSVSSNMEVISRALLRGKSLYLLAGHLEAQRTASFYFKRFLLKNSGTVRFSETLSDHIHQLSTDLGPNRISRTNAAVAAKAFLPNGYDTSPAIILADEIEALSTIAPKRDKRTAVLSVLLRPFLYLLAHWCANQWRAPRPESEELFRRIRECVSFFLPHPGLVKRPVVRGAIRASAYYIYYVQIPVQLLIRSITRILGRA